MPAHLLGTKIRQCLRTNIYLITMFNVCICNSTFVFASTISKYTWPQGLCSPFEWSLRENGAGLCAVCCGHSVRVVVCRRRLSSSCLSNVDHWDDCGHFVCGRTIGMHVCVPRSGSSAGSCSTIRKANNNSSIMDGAAHRLATRRFGSCMLCCYVLWVLWAQLSS